MVLTGTESRVSDHKDKYAGDAAPHQLRVLRGVSVNIIQTLPTVWW